MAKATKNKSAFHIQTLFCEDIRAEVGNKFSLMGVMEHTLLLNEFPATLGKFCMFFTISGPKSEKLTSLKLRIEIPGTEAMEMTPDPEAMQKAESQGEDGTISFRTWVIASPLQFPAAGTVNLTATINDTEMPAGSLNLAQIPPQ